MRFDTRAARSAGVLLVGVTEMTMVSGSIMNIINLTMNTLLGL